jgi:hypothetical protein
MSGPEQRPAHPRPVIVEISRFWPPEVALAVFELIDDLRNRGRTTGTGYPVLPRADDQIDYANKILAQPPIRQGAAGL